MTERQFRSVCTTTFATLRWTNISPGSRPTSCVAGTRLSEQPIHNYSGVCCLDRLSKKSRLCALMLSAQALFPSISFSSFRIFPHDELRLMGETPSPRPPQNLPASAEKDDGPDNL